MKDHHRTPRIRPNSLVVWQGGSDSGEELWTDRENRDLVDGGFDRSGEEDDLWSKDGVWFGRNAALQSARRTLRTNTGREVFDEEAELDEDGRHDIRTVE